MGAIAVSDSTRTALVDHVGGQGDLTLAADGSEERVGELLGLIAATREYQMA